MNVLADRFSDLSDPREDGKVIDPLTDILVIAVCAATHGGRELRGYPSLREEQDVLTLRVSGVGGWHTLP